MTNPFRKPTFTEQPSLNIDLWERQHDGRTEREVSRRRKYQRPSMFKRWLDRNFEGKLRYLFLLIGIGLALVGWCYFLATGDIEVNVIDCPPGSQRIHGFTNGHYTNLCVDPVNR